MTAATDREALLRAVCLSPGDDLPRLLLTDWCEENGEGERAEFIRVQIELWRRRDEYDSHDLMVRVPSYEALERRGRELLNRNWAHWHPIWHACNVVCENLAGNASGEVRVSFRRGLVGKVTLPCADWLGHGAALAACCPLQEAVLSDKKPGRQPVVGEGERWGWWDREHHPQHHDDLPTGLWGCLKDDCVIVGGWKWYTAEALALAALSRACVRWARRQAFGPEHEEWT